MSEIDNSEIAKAIREQTKFFEDCIKAIGYGVLIVIGFFAVLFGIPIVIDHLFPQHYDTPSTAPTQTTMNLQYGKSQEIALVKYQDWCTASKNVWVVNYSGGLPYCENIYGDKVRP